jgi:hypothetical protein
LAYNGAADSLHQLLMAREHGAHITNTPGRIVILADGSPYYFVEVTFEDGSHYGIEAMGNEAIKLYQEAMTVSSPVLLATN